MLKWNKIRETKWRGWWLNSNVCPHNTNTHSSLCKHLKRKFPLSRFFSSSWLSCCCLLVCVMLSSGAELSHCEQRGNQSLFTNQLSSVPGWRENTNPVWPTDMSIHSHTKHSSKPSSPLLILPLFSNHQALTQSNTLLGNHVFSGFEYV